MDRTKVGGQRLGQVDISASAGRVLADIDGLDTESGLDGEVNALRRLGEHLPGPALGDVRRPEANHRNTDLDCEKKCGGCECNPRRVAPILHHTTVNRVGSGTVFSVVTYCEP